jgi:hypothetical protein
MSSTPVTHEAGCSQFRVKHGKTEETTDPSNHSLASDVFRIRSSSEPAKLHLTFLDNTCVFQPSACTRVSGKSADIHLPFVSINPDFLEDSIGEELLGALSVDPSDSLTLPNPGVGVRPPWLTSIAALARREDRDTVTLAALLLERFKFQLLVTFREFEASACAKDGIDGAGSNKMVCLNERVDYQPHQFDSLVALITDLRSSARSVRELALTMNGAAIADLMKPFIESFLRLCDGGNLLSTVKPEDLYLTPIHFLASARKSVDYSAMGDAVAASLNRFDRAIESRRAANEAVVDRPRSGSKSTVEHDDSIEQSRPMSEEINSKDSLDQPISGACLSSDDVVNAGRNCSKKKKVKKKRKVWIDGVVDPSIFAHYPC